MRIKPEYLEKFESQLCTDFNCSSEVIHKKGNIITPASYSPKRRRAVTYEPMLRIVSYYDKVLVTCAPCLLDWADKRYHDTFSGWIFKYPRLQEIDLELKKHGQVIKDIHHYFLPLEEFPPAAPDFTVKWFEKNELEPFRDLSYPDAIAFHPLNPDMLAVAAMDGEQIMGVAGVSADAEELWQIGITVNEHYRGRGIASKLVTLLKDEVIRRGKVPFYGTAESHNLSNSVAIKSGFFPVWTELISGPADAE